MGILKAGK